MMTPEPVTSAGDCLVHGFSKSGRRRVEKTFTTAFSASCDMAGVGSVAGVVATTDPAFLVGSDGGGNGSAARADKVSRGTSTQPQSRETRVRVISSLCIGLERVVPVQRQAGRSILAQIRMRLLVGTHPIRLQSP